MRAWRGHFHASCRPQKPISRRRHLVQSRLQSRHRERAVSAADCSTVRTFVNVVRRNPYQRQRLPAGGVSSHPINTAKQTLSRSRDGNRRNLEHNTCWNNG